jgi:hypothetical protein
MLLENLSTLRLVGHKTTTMPTKPTPQNAFCLHLAAPWWTATITTPRARSDLPEGPWYTPVMHPHHWDFIRGVSGRNPTKTIAGRRAGRQRGYFFVAWWGPSRSLKVTFQFLRKERTNRHSCFILIQVKSRVARPRIVWRDFFFPIFFSFGCVYPYCH